MSRVPPRFGGSIRHGGLVCFPPLGATWLKRFIERVLDRSRSDRPTSQERRVEDVLFKRSLYDSPEAFLEDLLAELPPDEPLEDAALARIVRALRGPRGDAADEIDEAHEAKLGFWRTLAERFPDHPYAVACHGHALLVAEESSAALQRFLGAFALDPALFDEFADEIEGIAREHGGEVWLEYRLSGLRARIESCCDSEEEADLIREQYSELLDEHRGDAAALARIREVGKRIAELTDAEKLPRAMVRRGQPRVEDGEGD